MVWGHPDPAVTGCLSGSQVSLVQLGEEEEAENRSDLAVVVAAAPRTVGGLGSAEMEALGKGPGGGLG